MAEQRPSAAQSLYPHLYSGTPDAIERRYTAASAADAMYPRAKPPPKNPYLERMTEQAWSEHLLALSGLRRRR